jgi:hypothetical protein
MEFLEINDAALHRLSWSGGKPPLGAVHSFLSYDKAKTRFKLGARNTTSDNSTFGYNSNMRIKIKMSDLFSMPLIASYWCRIAYLEPASPVVHSLGLTEPFLARTMMSADKTAHKFGLEPLAADLLSIRCEYGFQRGSFDKAISNGTAPEWIHDNIHALRQIEKKVYNDHNLFVNIASAVAPSARIYIKKVQNNRMEIDNHTAE